MELQRIQALTISPSIGVVQAPTTPSSLPGVQNRSGRGTGPEMDPQANGGGGY